MTNITNLRERTAEYSRLKGECNFQSERDLMMRTHQMASDCADWQAAYDRIEASLTRLTGAVMAASANLDKKDEQIKMLREALEQYARVPNWGRPFDANGNLTNKRCLFMRFEEMHGFELAQETLAATGPSDILNEGENDVLRRKDD